MDHMADPGPNTGKGLASLDKFHWMGAALDKSCLSRSCLPEAHGFCGAEINARTTDSMRKKAGGPVDSR